MTERQEAWSGLAREIRKDVAKMLSLTGRGDLGTSLAMADLLVWLYWSYLRIDPQDPRQEDRDRVVLGTGGGAPALYATLARRGYFAREELWSFSRLGATLQGVPATLSIPGVDAPLAERGRGLALAAGMALGLRRKNQKCRVVCLLDGHAFDHGLFWESAYRCGEESLGAVTAVVACCAGGDGPTVSSAGAEGALRRRGWRVVRRNGHDLQALEDAVVLLEREDRGPGAVLAETTFGQGVRRRIESDERFVAEGHPWDRAALDAALREIDGEKGDDTRAPFVF